MTTRLVHDEPTQARIPSPPVGFEEFVIATGERMLRTAVLLTGDRHAADDLVQSAYATAFARWRLVRVRQAALEMPSWPATSSGRQLPSYNDFGSGAEAATSPSPSSS